MNSSDARENIRQACAARRDLLDAQHQTALRLLNGFYEGCPGLVIDLFGQTLVLYNFADPPHSLPVSLTELQTDLLNEMPWVRTVVCKTRHAVTAEERRGRATYGGPPDNRILENGVWYAVDLLLNQDASFYVDTRNVRTWLQQHSVGQSVLNTFAYTGSLGIAALAGGADQVLQTDLNPRFLQLSRQSCQLNGWPPDRNRLQAGDFFTQVSNFKQGNRMFEIAVLDPPFFSTTRGGKVDLVTQSHRLINKIRPLIYHNGWLVSINNALFVSGAEYLQTLESLCSAGYMQIETLLPIPDDVACPAASGRAALPADPAPFNHPTKIAVLRILRKDGLQRTR